MQLVLSQASVSILCFSRNKTNKHRVLCLQLLAFAAFVQRHCDVAECFGGESCARTANGRNSECARARGRHDHGNCSDTERMVTFSMITTALAGKNTTIVITMAKGVPGKLPNMHRLQVSVLSKRVEQQDIRVDVSYEVLMFNTPMLRNSTRPFSVGYYSCTSSYCLIAFAFRLLLLRNDSN